MRTHHQSWAAWIAALTLAGCGSTARLQVADGTGPDPRLPPPDDEGYVPVVNIAPAVGWNEGETPLVAAGLRVSAFADGLDHPRWIHVLPNGDVLVAETNAPERPLREELLGVKGWVMGKVMKRAGAAVPSANRITLLRDADNDGSPEGGSARLFPGRPQPAVRHGACTRHALCRQHGRTPGLSQTSGGPNSPA